MLNKTKKIFQICDLVLILMLFLRSDYMQIPQDEGFFDTYTFLNTGHNAVVGGSGRVSAG